MKKQRKHINLSRITAFILSVAMLAGFCPQGVSFSDIPITLPKVNAAENKSNPRIVKDSSMDAGQKVTWDCVYFGSYPQSEVTSKDGSIYNALKNATGWDENNDITIGGTKYRRLKGEDATSATSDEEGLYDWKDNYKTYHYFKYEPIKWRVLNRNGNDALLLADVLDDQKYNTNYVGVTWETSSMRSWLNGYGASVNQPKTDYSRKNFINSAFTSTQRSAIKTTNVVNNNNIDYGTAGGKNTLDKVFLLSESEVYNTDMAAGYGFVKDYSTYDEARRSRCSTYAYAMGIWYDADAGYTKDNGILWWLRSPGFHDRFTALVYYNGTVYGSGYEVNDCNYGVRPALHLNLASSNLYSYAGTVCSDAMKFSTFCHSKCDRKIFCFLFQFMQKLWQAGKSERIYKMCTVFSVFMQYHNVTDSISTFPMGTQFRKGSIYFINFLFIQSQSASDIHSPFPSGSLRPDSPDRSDCGGYPDPASAEIREKASVWRQPGW